MTVCAPADGAFAQLPEEDLNALPEDRKKLTQVLTHHVGASAWARPARGAAPPRPSRSRS
ncbi:fasciclin domain-containing protein [Streptomyces sp. TRM70308]|uniref:fasciclin domain-containing protein n=1 Tax=Streptomyces sp. TRM70308 TaxID=3131932 RepID=UPI003D042420